MKLRWIADIVAGVATSYFMNQKRQSSQGVILKVGSILLRRVIFYTVGSLAAAILAVGGLFIALVDLGRYINTNGGAGLSAVGWIGLTLIAAALLSLYFVYKSPVRLRDEELRALQTQPASIGEMVLATILDNIRGSQGVSDDGVKIKNKKSKYDPEYNAKEYSRRNRDWSNYTSF